MMTSKIIALIKWGRGYPTDAFNLTYRALRHNLSSDVNICCITDCPDGLDPEIQIVDLPDIPLDRSTWVPGMWPKLAMFKQGVFPDGARVLFTDVDVAIVANMDSFFDIIGEQEVLIIKDWKTYHERWFPKLFPISRGGNSSVVGFIAGQHSYLWDRFCESPSLSIHKYGNDQNYITGEAKSLIYFPEHWVGSFKKSVAPLPPIAWFSACQPHPECKVVAFHGKPDISDLTRRNKSYLARLIEGFGTVQWIEDYFDKYAPHDRHP